MRLFVRKIKFTEEEKQKYEHERSCTLELIREVQHERWRTAFWYKEKPRASPAAARLRAAREYDGNKWRFDSDGTGIVYSNQVTPLHAFKRSPYQRATLH